MNRPTKNEVRRWLNANPPKDHPLYQVYEQRSRSFENFGFWLANKHKEADAELVKEIWEDPTIWREIKEA